MKKLQIDGSVDLYKIISFLKQSTSEEITLVFLNDSLIHKNASNINVIKKLAEGLNKSIIFESENPALNDYLRIVDEGGNQFHNSPVNLDDEDEVSTSKMNFAGMISGLNIFNKLKFKGIPRSSSSGFKSDSKAGLYKIGIISVVIIACLVISIWSFLLYVPKALVTLKVDSDVFIKLIDVKADAKATSVSVDANIIPASEVTAEDFETRTVDATGVKQVGEKAKGEVTVTNKKDSKVKIKKGAKLKVKNNDKTLTYLVTEDKEINATEEIADTDPNTDGDQAGTKFGEGTLKIEAETFGVDYNIDKDKTFEIEGNDKDDVFAKNKDKIDGGSSKEVKAVAQADLDKLKKEVEDAIKEKFKTTLRGRLASDQVLSEGSIVITPVKAEYTQKLADEVDSVGLTATYSAKAFSYNKANLDEVISASITKVIPENFKLSTEKPEYDAIPVNSSEDGILNIQVKLRSTILPDLDVDKIKQDLSGMTLEEAQSYVNALPNIQETSIELAPNLPGPLLRMPKRPQNIEIKL